MRRPASDSSAAPGADRRHDVLIAGGGPAGATAAILLARAGVPLYRPAETVRPVPESARLPRPEAAG